MKLRFVFFVSTLLFAHAVSAKTIYKSVDNDGNVSLSDRPFPNAQAFTIDEPDDTERPHRDLSHLLAHATSKKSQPVQAPQAVAENNPINDTAATDSGTPFADNNVATAASDDNQTSDSVAQNDDDKDDAAPSTEIKDAALKSCHDNAVRSVMTAYPCNKISIATGNGEENLRTQREHHECLQRQQIALAALEVTYERSCRLGNSNFSKEVTQ